MEKTYPVIAALAAAAASIVAAVHAENAKELLYAAPMQRPDIPDYLPRELATLYPGNAGSYNACKDGSRATFITQPYRPYDIGALKPDDKTLYITDIHCPDYFLNHYYLITDQQPRIVPIAGNKLLVSIPK